MTYLEMIEHLRGQVARAQLPVLEKKTGIAYGQLKHFSDKGGNLRDPSALLKLATHYGFTINVTHFTD